MKTEGTAKYADMFAALGAEPRLQIVRLLLSAHPDGMTVGDIQAELEIPNSTLSHHLEKLRMESLVTVTKDKQWLWYSANSDALQDLLGFLYAECCTRSRAVEPVKITAKARR
jgi:ArsR family transcriptional regulator, arsenate/arsenite/antimonite-responsive transcriptional repressor